MSDLVPAASPRVWFAAAQSFHFLFVLVLLFTCLVVPLRFPLLSADDGAFLLHFFFLSTTSAFGPLPLVWMPREKRRSHRLATAFRVPTLDVAKRPAVCVVCLAGGCRRSFPRILVARCCGFVWSHQQPERREISPFSRGPQGAINSGEVLTACRVSEHASALAMKAEDHKRFTQQLLPWNPAPSC